MIIEELHYEFFLLSDKIGGNDRRSFSASQVDWFLNKAQQQLINNYVSAFETDNRKINELASLHIKYPLQEAIIALEHNPINSRGRTVYLYEVRLAQTVLPYQSMTRVWAYSQKSNCDIKAYGRNMEADDLDDALTNSFDLDEKSFFINFGRTSNLVPNTNREQISAYVYSLYPIKNKEIYVEYIKRPQRMNLGGYTYFDNTLSVRHECELSENLQSKMIDLAVMIAYGSMNDEAYNLKKDLMNNN